jgi:6-phosphogluconate dehydrogenase
MIGLGRMGANMLRRLRRSDIDAVGYDRNTEIARALADECGMLAADGVEDLVSRLGSPRMVWLMLPAGEITEHAVANLRDLLAGGDILIDGANSHFKDSMRRGAWLAEQGIHFMDAGVSGGVWGLERGYALTVGGSRDAVSAVRPLLEILAPAADRGWLHCGPVGSGHFVKMIHNAIEYGMMQAYAEGFSLMRGRAEFDLDLAAIAETWRHGSVVRSWLLDLTADYLAEDAELATIEPVVADSGEGRWAAIEAIEQGVPAPIMTTALMMRFASQGRLDYASKLLAIMRKQFGGHAIKESSER